MDNLKELRFPKPFMPPPVSVVEFCGVRPPYTSIVTVMVDKGLAGSVAEEIHKQLDSIEDRGFSPAYISVNSTGYEALISAQYMESKIARLPREFMDYPIVLNPAQLKAVQVLCQPDKEFLYNGEIRR